MSNSYEKHGNPDVYPEPSQDEEGLVLQVDWTKEEEAKAKRK